MGVLGYYAFKSRQGFINLTIEALEQGVKYGQG